MRESSAAVLPGRVACPACGHALFTVALPAAAAAPVGDAMAHSQGVPGPLLLRIAEAARLLGISRTAMYQLVAANGVPVVRIGRSIRVVRAGLDGWIAERLQR